MHNGVKSPIFYGYKNQDPWIFKIWVFETEQFFAQVHLSNDKQRMWYSKTRVSAGRTLEYWNYYESLHFRFHWSQITWERRKIFFHSFPSNLRPMKSKVKKIFPIKKKKKRMKEYLCSEYFPQHFHKDLQPSHSNL